MRKGLLAIVCTVIMLGSPALGMGQNLGDWHSGIKDRVQAAKASIDRGIEKGKLTRHEARQLNEELDAVLDRIDRMKRDGRLNEREREKIHRDLDRLESNIKSEKRDDEKRW